MKSFFLIAALFFMKAADAQQTTVVTQSDSIPQKQKLNPFTAFDKIKEQNKRMKSLIIPAGLITYGFIALENDGLKKLDNNTKLEIREDHPTFVSKLDNYLQFAPAVAVYGLNAFGIKGKNNFRDRSMIYLMSNIILNTTVFSVKKLTHQLRPDGSAYTSFPSGHTAEAFASAEFMRQEYKDVSPWYGIAGYAAATTTGVLRLYNNKHWVSDVVAGAGFGILSTKLAYWIYPSIKRKFFKDKPMNAMVMPYYQSGGGGLALVYNFRH
ncbi:MAG: phosphatase PAP2 family protein [Chitinophagaceae bacterium]